MATTKHCDCVNYCDNFCYVCGEFAPKSQRMAVTGVVKKAYIKLLCALNNLNKPWLLYKQGLQYQVVL